MIPATAPPERLSARERRWLPLTDLSFLVCALAALAWLPARPSSNALLCLGLVAAYGVASNVRVPAATGWAPPVELVFVPMLFLAPLNLVPLLVLAGTVVSEVAWRVGTHAPLERSVLCLGDSWWSLGPVLVLAAAGADAFGWEHWPVYVAALAAQLAINALVSWARIQLYEDRPPRARDMLVVPPVVDVLLFLPALAVVAVSVDAPVAAALTGASLLAIAGGFMSERSGRLAERVQATHDPLTGLPNRVLLGELAAAASARARRDGGSCAVMLVDLDAFKAVNDELGHHAGDAVLAEAATRLRRAVRDADTVARLGGDEFAVLLTGAQTAGACEVVASKLRRAFDEPFALPTGPRRVSVSVGAALIDGSRAFEDALRDADMAMYADKHGG